MRGAATQAMRDIAEERQRSRCRLAAANRRLQAGVAISASLVVNDVPHRLLLAP